MSTEQLDTGMGMEMGADAESLAALIAGQYDYREPRRNEIREATIIAIESSQVIVDVGAKRDGIVPQRDLEYLSDEVRESLKIGARVPVAVMNVSDHNDELLVSINKGMAQQDWLNAEAQLASGETCTATVSEANRGGIVVSYGRVRGFVPISHLSSIPRGLRGEQLDQAKNELIGQKLTLAVIEVNRRDHRLILSERVARQQQRAKLLEELAEGDVRPGIVRSLTHYGAFVDIGGIDGLVHISELDWAHVAHPRDVVSVGDEIEVYVLSVDRERERISLSRKRLLPDPWFSVTENMVQGEIIPGRVTNVADFGVFVDVGEGIEGLVHASEIPEEQLEAGIVSGAEVAVRVIDIDSRRHRISLSMRHVPEISPEPLPEASPEAVSPES
jgi:small subunit ribosomal protein S1